MLSRRDLVGRLAAGTAAAVCVTGLTGVSVAATSQATKGRRQDDPSTPESQQVVDAETPATEKAPAPWELLSPLAAGSVVANDWIAAGLTGVVDGSCVMTVKNQRGHEHRIHVCRNDGTPEGLIFTDRFDLVVMNGGRGDLPTEEGLAQAVAEVAHVLAQNESTPQAAAVLSSLMPQGERVSRFSGSADRRLR